MVWAMKPSLVGNLLCLDESSNVFRGLCKLKHSKTLIYLTYHDEKEFIHHSIMSLRDNLRYADFDIVIVDTSVGQNFDESITAELGHNVQIIKIPKNLISVISQIYRSFLSEYDYIMRLDADDILYPKSISYLITELNASKELSAVYGNWDIINQVGAKLARVSAPSPNSMQGFHGACTMFRCKDLKSLDFNKVDINSQDGFLSYIHLLFNNRTIKKINQTIFSYRRHDQNISNDHGKLWASRIKILRYYVGIEQFSSTIFIDSDENELGPSDYHFISNNSDIWYISDGRLTGEGRADIRIPPQSTLTAFILNSGFTRTGGVAMINLKKLSGFYFDGLVEAFVRFSILSESKEVSLVKVIYETVWMHLDNQYKCVNIRDGLYHPIFVKVPGLNFYNFNYSKKMPFVMTNDFLAGFTMLYD